MTTLATPTVSVVIPTYLRADKLRAAIDSVLRQTVPAHECLVIGMESDSATKAVIDSFDEPRILWLAQPTTTPGGLARNIGVRASSGDYIAFLDDDDTWHPEKLERQLAHLLSMPDPAKAVVASRFFDEAKARVFPTASITRNLRAGSFLFDRKSISATAHLPTSGILTSATLARKVPFDETLLRHQDWDWLLRCAAAGGEIEMPEQTLWRKGADETPSVGSGTFQVSSVEWACSQSDTLTRHELAGLCLTTLLPAAAKSHDWGSVARLVMLAARKGRIRLRHIAIATAHLLRALATKSSCPFSGRHSAVQVVTQLERAGAQTVALAIEKILESEFHIETRFLYAKSESDLFPVSAALVATRPSSVADAWGLVAGVFKIAGRDVVIAHTHYSIVLALPAAALRRARKRIAVHHWPEAKYPLVCRVAIRVYRRTGIITDEVYVSPDLPRPLKSSVIRNPLPGKLDASELVETPSLDLLCVARHAGEKNIPSLVRAMAYLPERHLTLIGVGEDTELIRSEIERLHLSDRVDVIEGAANTWVRSAMSRCRLVVLPSLWEATPMVLLEAASLGTPFAISNISELRQFAEAGVALIFDPLDPVDIAETIRLSDNPAELLRLTENLEDFRALFAEPAIRREWLRVLS